MKNTHDQILMFTQGSPLLSDALYPVRRGKVCPRCKKERIEFIGKVCTGCVISNSTKSNGGKK